jgi:hypothetical protein
LPQKTFECANFFRQEAPPVDCPPTGRPEKSRRGNWIAGMESFLGFLGLIHLYAGFA